MLLHFQHESALKKYKYIYILILPSLYAVVDFEGIMSCWLTYRGKSPDKHIIFKPTSASTRDKPRGNLDSSFPGRSELHFSNTFSHCLKKSYKLGILSAFWFVIKWFPGNAVKRPVQGTTCVATIPSVSLWERDHFTSSTAMAEYLCAMWWV